MTAAILAAALAISSGSGPAQSGADTGLRAAAALTFGQVGTVQEGGVATWCAPTPTHCQSWGGSAMVGATSTYSGKPYVVTVRHGSRSVVVTVVSYCACGMRHGKDTLIDLSKHAFEQLAPLSQGVVDVTVEYGAIPLPQTDTAPEPLDWYRWHELVG